jgi:hypothetical protein
MGRACKWDTSCYGCCIQWGICWRADVSLAQLHCSCCHLLPLPCRQVLMPLLNFPLTPSQPFSCCHHHPVRQAHTLQGGHGVYWWGPDGYFFLVPRTPMDPSATCSTIVSRSHSHPSSTGSRPIHISSPTSQHVASYSTLHASPVESWPPSASGARCWIVGRVRLHLHLLCYRRCLLLRAWCSCCRGSAAGVTGSGCDW